MQSNTRVILIALLVMLVGVVSSGAFNVMVASSQGRHELVFTDRAEDGAPLEVSLGVAMGAFRGIFVNILWIRANDAKESGRFYESVELARSITRLQPRLPRVWTFHAWNLAYNISVTTHTPQERWQWVNAGIDLLRKDALRTNPNDMHIHKELAWILLHKVGGYTDDANQHYKRRFAYQWHNIMGPAPVIPPDQRGRDRVIELYARWVQDIVDAPDTLAELREINPVAGRIADEFERRIGEPLGEDYLRRYQLDIELERAGRSGIIESGRAGPKTRALHEMRRGIGTPEDWEALADHVRKRVLIDEYNMEPVRMVQQVYRFGPIDWRLPTAHSLYWAARGTDVGRMQVNPNNSDSFDFLNAFRMVMQSIQELWRHGDLYFNYIDIHEGRKAYYQGVPNVYFVRSYGDMLEDVVKASGIYEEADRPYRQYSSGYENFLTDAIRFFYRRGDTERAEYWYRRLRTFEGQNTNTPDRTFVMSLPLEEFVEKELYDRFDSPQVAVSEVYGALQSAYFNGLLVGDRETFEGSFSYARSAHAYFFQKQFNEVAASTNTARMEYMDRDFTFVAGRMLANTITALPPSEAEIMYDAAPDDLKRYAYDPLALRWKNEIDALHESGASEPFDILFPEPSGMEEFRARLERKKDERSDRGIEGVRTN